MPVVDLDFGAVGKVPEGWFRVVCDKATFKKNKSGDNYIINMQNHLADMPEGNLPGSEVPYEAFENLNIFDNVSFKLSSRWKLQEVLSAFTGEDWEDDNMKLEVECEHCDEDGCSHDKIVPVLIDQTAVGLVYSEIYQGKPQARVRRYIPDNGFVEFGPDETE